MRLVLVGISHHRAPGRAAGARRARRRAAPPRSPTALAGAALEAVVPLDLQPHRAVPRRRRGARGESRALDDARRDRGGRSAPVALPAARRGGGAAPLPRRGRARLDGARRGRDPRPGAGRLRGRLVRARCSTGSFARRSTPGKKVRVETAIGESPASVSAAAAALAQQVFGDLDGRRVADRGAGKIGELAARQPALARRRIAFVANRRPSERPSWPRRLGASRSRSSSSGEELARGRRGRLVDERARLRAHAGRRSQALPGRRGAPLFLIDLAVPRDLDPAIHELDGCYLYDIDDLEAVVAESLAGRRREAERAETIVGRGGRAVPRVAGLARRRSRDRVAARARRGDPRGGARRPKAGSAVSAPTASVESRRSDVELTAPDRMKQAACTADGVAMLKECGTLRARRGAVTGYARPAAAPRRLVVRACEREPKAGHRRCRAASRRLPRQ